MKNLYRKKMNHFIRLVLIIFGVQRAAALEVSSAEKVFSQPYLIEYINSFIEEDIKNCFNFAHTNKIARTTIVDRLEKKAGMMAEINEHKLFCLYTRFYFIFQREKPRFGKKRAPYAEIIRKAFPVFQKLQKAVRARFTFLNTYGNFPNKLTFSLNPRSPEYNSLEQFYLPGSCITISNLLGTPCFEHHSFVQNKEFIEQSASVISDAERIMNLKKFQRRPGYQYCSPITLMDFYLKQTEDYVNYVALDMPLEKIEQQLTLWQKIASIPVEISDLLQGTIQDIKKLQIHSNKVQDIWKMQLQPQVAFLTKSTVEKFSFVIKEAYKQEGVSSPFEINRRLEILLQMLDPYVVSRFNQFDEECLSRKSFLGQLQSALSKYVEVFVKNLSRSKSLEKSNQIMTDRFQKLQETINEIDNYSNLLSKYQDTIINLKNFPGAWYKRYLYLGLNLPSGPMSIEQFIQTILEDVTFEKLSNYYNAQINQLNPKIFYPMEKIEELYLSETKDNSMPEEFLTKKLRLDQ